MVYTKYEVRAALNKANRMQAPPGMINKDFFEAAKRQLKRLLKIYSIYGSEGDKRFTIKEIQSQITKALHTIVHGSHYVLLSSSSKSEKTLNAHDSGIQEFIKQSLIEQTIQECKDSIYKILEGPGKVDLRLLEKYKRKIWVYSYLLVKYHEVENIDSCLVSAENLELDSVAEIVHNNPLSPLERSAIKELTEQNEECDAMEQEFLDRYEIKQLKLCIFEAVTTVPQERLDQTKSEQGLLPLSRFCSQYWNR